MTLVAGTTLGRYQILEPLGQGGMATVYKAFQPSLQREVALKVLRPGYAQDEEFRGRFEREAIAIAKLRHPHIVQVFDFEIAASGEYVLAMEFLEGGTLKERLTRLATEGCGIDPNESVRIVGEVAEALSYAHEKGVVHRDVKPSNVMLTQKDWAVVTDFGIARILGATSHTQTGVGIGTPEYMAPEQGQGGSVDHRADIYSLGAMAYELLVGRVPYTADTPLAVVIAHIKDPLPLPSKVNPSIGAGVERALLRALAKDPAARYESALAFAEALKSGLFEDSRGGPMPTIVVRGAAAAATSVRPATKPVMAAISVAFTRPATLRLAGVLVVAIVAGTVAASGALRTTPAPLARDAPTTGTAAASAPVAPSGMAAPGTPAVPTPAPKFAVPAKGALIWEAKLDGTESDMRGAREFGSEGTAGRDPTASDLRFVPGAIDFVIIRSRAGTGMVWNSPARENLVAEFDVAASASGNVSFVWRVGEQAAVHVLVIDMRAGRAEIRRPVRAGLSEPISPSVQVPEVRVGAFTVAVFVNGTHHEVYVNQRKVVEITDNEPTRVPTVPLLQYESDVPSTLRVTGMRMYELPK